MAIRDLGFAHLLRPPLGLRNPLCPDPACADLYRFSEGYYPSVEAHDAANPCM
jgi:hypothetical protein